MTFQRTITIRGLDMIVSGTYTPGSPMAPRRAGQDPTDPPEGPELVVSSIRAAGPSDNFIDYIMGIPADSDAITEIEDTILDFMARDR